MFFPHKVNSPYNYDMIVIYISYQIMKGVSTRIKASVDHSLSKTKIKLFYFKMSSVFKNFYGIHVVYTHEAQF